MLIIFDLDDTLIDTTGSVLPFQLERAFFLMAQKKMTLEDKKEILALNVTCQSSKEVLSEWGQRKGLTISQIRLGIQALSFELPPDFQIKCTPFAKETLQVLSKQHLLALVTAGKTFFQIEKLKKAGIEVSYFSKILISEDFVKKTHYMSLAREFSMKPAEIWVCGDLLPAHELGYKTIHMRWGRGKFFQTEKWIDYSIENLSQLTRFILP